MMGDNRDNSTDSRMLSVVGYVPFENIVGQAGIVFFFDSGRWTLLESMAVARDGPMEASSYPHQIIRTGRGFPVPDWKAQPQADAAAAVSRRFIVTIE